ncbi:unnamed protein product [Parnassius apollo]|uniref:(apollo) hypothetical protein n=1 Tax=Parnassius apollo TaxID=110799 RepID=A0A8S3Y388_PARAO|nr:unnamed protein product [Parnassius apollo]
MDKINIQEINTICDDDSLLDDTYVDYEILGMHENLIPIPDTVNAGVQTIGENIVQYEEIIHEGIAGSRLSSPTILQTNTPSNIEDHDSAELGKENQEPSSHSIYLNEGSDFSAGSGDEYQPPRRDRSSSTSSSIVSSIKRGKKRIRYPNKWKQNIRKTLKNLGKEYSSKTGNQIEAKKMRPSCRNCKFSCCDNFTTDERQQIFDCYWALGSLQRQRDFLSACINIPNIICRRVKNPAKQRTPNCLFSFMKNGQTPRICNTFLLNTLGIAQRTLRTVIEAKTSESGIAPCD